MYKNVERIIAHHEGDNTKYFCKWLGLGYECCIWETQDKIRPIAKDQIEMYTRREAEGKFPYKSVAYVRYQHPPFVKIEKDPAYICNTGRELKDFQLTRLNWLGYVWSKGENGILAECAADHV